jgi:hypothetical protein
MGRSGVLTDLARFWAIFGTMTYDVAVVARTTSSTVTFILTGLHLLKFLVHIYIETFELLHQAVV